MGSLMDSIMVAFALLVFVGGVGLFLGLRAGGKTRVPGGIILIVGALVGLGADIWLVTGMKGLQTNQEVSIALAMDGVDVNRMVSTTSSYGLVFGVLALACLVTGIVILARQPATPTV